MPQWEVETIKDTCDSIRQIQSPQFVDQTEEKERFIELDILLNRLCLCDIPNLPNLVNRETIQIWVEKCAPEQIEFLIDIHEQMNDEVEKIIVDLRKK